MAEKEPNKKKVEHLKVARGTNTISLSDSIINGINNGSDVVISSVGPKAISQVVKSLAVARNKLLQSDIKIAWYSQWKDILGKTDGKELSALYTYVILM